MREALDGDLAKDLRAAVHQHMRIRFDITAQSASWLKVEAYGDCELEIREQGDGYVITAKLPEYFDDEALKTLLRFVPDEFGLSMNGDLQVSFTTLPPHTRYETPAMVLEANLVRFLEGYRGAKAFHGPRPENGISPDYQGTFRGPHRSLIGQALPEGP